MLEFWKQISTHTSLAGRDAIFSTDAASLPFLLTRPSRDVTYFKRKRTNVRIFLLTRPSRDVTFLLFSSPTYHVISTHTSLAGRDDLPVKEFEYAGTISTHTSLAGRD